MEIVERRNNMYVIATKDGIVVADVNELIMGNDETIIGHFFNNDSVTVAQPIKRFSSLAQTILQYLIKF